MSATQIAVTSWERKGKESKRKGEMTKNEEKTKEEERTRRK